MRLLLDTHTLIWLVVGDSRLSPGALAAIQSDEARNWLSVATLWEIAIKQSLGKLALGDDSIARLVTRADSDGIQLVPITAAHCQRIVQLPKHHRDPFDRMLVAQALEEGMSIVSAYPDLDAYGIDRIW